MISQEPQFFDGVKLSKRHFILLFLIAGAIFFDQMDNFNFGFMAPYMKQSSLQLSDEVIGQILGLYFVGMLAGGLLSGPLSNRIGRKGTYLFSVLVFSVFSICSGLAPTALLFMVFRTLTGLGIACFVVACFPYLIEMLPQESRGKWATRVSAIGLIGVPVVGIMCRMILPLDPEAWRIIAIVGGFGLLFFVLGIFLLDESPRWLVSKGREEEAAKVLERMTGRKFNPEQLKGTVAPLGQTLNAKGEKITGLKVLGEAFSKKFLKRTLVLGTIYMLLTVSSFVFLSWAPTLMDGRGYDPSIIALAIAFGIPIGAFVASFVAEKGGRKVPMVCFAGFIAFLALGFAFGTAELLVVAIVFLITGSINGFSVIFFAYTPENYPIHLRATMNGILWSSGRALTAIVQPLIPLIYATIGFTALFCVMGAIFLIASLLLGLFGIKTSGKSLEEISDE